MKSFVRFFTLVCVLAATSLMTGCGSLMSLQPLATDANTTFDPALLGTWGDPNGDDSDFVHVAQGQNQAYDILWIEPKDNETYHLKGQLVQIGGERVLDVTPQNKNEGVLTIPAHAFVLIKKVNNDFQLQFLDSQWLQEKAQQSSSLPTSRVDGRFVVTGTTAQLQNFILQFGLDDQARSEPMIMRRLQ